MRIVAGIKTSCAAVGGGALLVALVMLAGGSDAAPTPPAKAKPAAYAGPKPCKRVYKSDHAVARACAEGGAKQAGKVMQQMVKQTKKQLGFNCDSCHKDVETDPALLTKDGLEKFKKLVAASAKP